MYTGDMRPSVLVFLALFIALAATLPTSEPASACASIGRRGPVHIKGEEALIVWDPARRKQHFVRIAGFGPTAEDFGFLVPTPSRPELGEASDQVFSRLFDIYRVVRPQPRGVIDRGGGAPRSRGGVEVLERRSVAGLDAAVLQADDASALNQWLARHGYPSSPPLERWLAPYVARRWTVTAFRFDPSQQRGGRFVSRALRMSFDADAPFFPYSEPQDRAAPPEVRPFRVSVVAPTRMRAVPGTVWNGRVVYADQPRLRLESALRAVVPPDSFGPSSWLTVFDEPRSLRGSTDVVFEEDPRQQPVAPRVDRMLVPY